jgi:hypothetical protein
MGWRATRDQTQSSRGLRRVATSKRPAAVATFWSPWRRRQQSAMLATQREYSLLERSAAVPWKMARVRREAARRRAAALAVAVEEEVEVMLALVVVLPLLLEALLAVV